MYFWKFIEVSDDEKESAIDENPIKPIKIDDDIDKKQLITKNEEQDKEIPINPGESGKEIKDNKQENLDYNLRDRKSVV